MPPASGHNLGGGLSAAPEESISFGPFASNASASQIGFGHMPSTKSNASQTNLNMSAAEKRRKEARERKKKQQGATQEVKKQLVDSSCSSWQQKKQQKN